MVISDFATLLLFPEKIFLDAFALVMFIFLKSKYVYVENGVLLIDYLAFNKNSKVMLCGILNNNLTSMSCVVCA